VAGILVNRSTRLLLSYVMAPYRPRFTLSAFSELFGFSKWVVVNSILNFANSRLDTFVIGRVSGVSSLGIYSMAYEVSNMATTELVAPISRALFPGFSKLQDNPQALVKAYNMSLATIVMFALPVTVGIGLTAEYFVPLLLGDKWLLVIPIMEVLVIYGGLRVSLANTSGLYLALGRPYLITVMSLSNLVVLAPTMIWAVQKFGPIGAAWSLVAGAIPMVVLMFVFNRLYLGTRVIDTVFTLIRPIVAAALMAAVVYTLKKWLPVSADWGALVPNLMGLILAGVSVYVGTLAIMVRFSRAESTPEAVILDFVRAKISRRRR
jgi:lipopolysaccharide exporter